MTYILYDTGDTVAVITPTGDLPLPDVAKKDVPAGARYIIVDSLPDAPMEAWRVDWSGIEGITVDATKVASRTLAVFQDHLAQVRYATEQGGTVWRDYTLQTDDRSQAKYLAELAAIDQGVRADPSPWKLTDGFVMLSNDDIKAMAIAARAHVMACFAAEAAVQSSLADLSTLDAVATAFATALAQIKEASHA